jgi:hypothetical protein
MHDQVESHAHINNNHNHNIKNNNINCGPKLRETLDLSAAAGPGASGRAAAGRRNLPFGRAHARRVKKIDKSVNRVRPILL